MEKTELWHSKETRTLIGIWSEDEVQRELEGTVRNQKVFQKISQRMWELGYNRSPDRCRMKIKKLKQDYRKLKEYNKRNGMNPKTNQWYEALDAVLGRRLGVTETSTSSLLESVMKCNSVEDRADTDDEDVLSGAEINKFNTLFIKSGFGNVTSLCRSLHPVFTLQSVLIMQMIGTDPGSVLLNFQ